MCLEACPQKTYVNATPSIVSENALFQYRIRVHSPSIYMEMFPGRDPKLPCSLIIFAMFPFSLGRFCAFPYSMEPLSGPQWLVWRSNTYRLGNSRYIYCLRTHVCYGKRRILVKMQGKNLLRSSTGMFEDSLLFSNYSGLWNAQAYSYSF